MTPRAFLAIAASVVLFGSVGLATPNAAAHTQSDVIAVPAGSEATVTLKPTHGCDGSPTTEVSIQAPVPGATAGVVSGWTETSTADPEGRTVLDWVDGSLPSDRTGEFPVTFQVPDTPGELLTFPSVQVCENGEELSWINGDPDSEYPAPRLLILPAGSAAATALAQVPEDVPGRDLLVQIVDVDGTSVDDSTASNPAAPTTADPSMTVEPERTATPAATGSRDEGSGPPWIALGLIAFAAVAGAGVWLRARRASSAD